MLGTISKELRKQDFNFEHTLVKIAANRSCNEVKLAGLIVGPFEEGNEYEVQSWIAEELKKTGIARLREEELDAPRLYKIQWTERVQTAGQISKLPDNFYPKLRRYLRELEDGTKTYERMREHEKVTHLIQDIVNARLRKIISIASASTRTEQALKNFTEEERFLYEHLYGLVLEWRKQILECRRNEK